MSTSAPKSKPATPKFFNRELSWLAFNERVLDQAFSEKYPLFERTRFLSFVSSNLDQFYEIRVAGLMQKVDAGITRPSLDGSAPQSLLEEVRERAHAMSQREYDCWRSHLQPSLAKNGVHFKSIEKLTKEEFTWLRAYFRREVFPVLTPLAVDPTHPFPLDFKQVPELVCVAEEFAPEKSGSITGHCAGAENPSPVGENRKGEFQGGCVCFPK